MLNTENALLSRVNGEAARRAGFDPNEILIASPQHFNDAAMMQRNDGLIPASQEPAEPALEEKEIYDPVQEAAPAAPDHGGAATAKPAAQPAAKPAAKPAEKPAQPPAAKPAAAPAAKQGEKPAPLPVITVAGRMSPDQLCQEYARMFKATLGLELSMSICFENMRRMCEVDTRDPVGTLYFLENTYRVSTIIYLAQNLPILFVTSVLAEKNRKNILKYVMTEVENGSKPYEDILELRKRRWMRKFENMSVNDAMTVTPGATMLSPELAARLRFELTGVSSGMRRYNREMAQIVEKFDDGARNDIVYIYSNWWHLLQGFENVPEMRAYIMAVTDDTKTSLGRKNA